MTRAALTGQACGSRAAAVTSPIRGRILRVTRTSAGLSWWMEPWPNAQDGGIDSAAQDVEDVLHACLSAGGQTPQGCAADHHGACAQCDGFDDVAAASDPAVQQDFNVVTDSLGDRG